jgi:uncharacterized protein YecE (DUF72 family)
MKFGRADNIPSIDFTLPPDHPETTAYLASLSKKASGHQPSIHAGCAKWNRKEWLDIVYPKGTPANQFLHTYSRVFNSVELNSTGYSFKSFKSFEDWRAQTPKDFSFSPKFPRVITHFKKMKGSAPEDAVRFLELASGLGEGMGLPLLQMDEKFGPDMFEIMEAFIPTVAKAGNIALELRNPGWFDNTDTVSRTAELLRDHNVTWVITDTPGRRDVIHMVVTAPRIFIRFSGCNVPELDYARMDAWVERLESWTSQGVREVYWYAHNEPEDFTPKQCAYFLSKINTALDLQVRGTQLLNA